MGVAGSAEPRTIAHLSSEALTAPAESPRRAHDVMGTRFAAEVTFRRVTGSTGPVPVSGTSTWIRSGCSRSQGRRAPPVPTRLARRTARSGSPKRTLGSSRIWTLGSPPSALWVTKRATHPPTALQIGVSATLQKKLIRYFTLDNTWSGGDSNSRSLPCERSRRGFGRLPPTSQNPT